MQQKNVYVILVSLYFLSSSSSRVWIRVRITKETDEWTDGHNS